MYSCILLSFICTSNVASTFYFLLLALHVHWWHCIFLCTLFVRFLFFLFLFFYDWLELQVWNKFNQNYKMTPWLLLNLNENWDLFQMLISVWICVILRHNSVEMNPVIVSQHCEIEPLLHNKMKSVRNVWWMWHNATQCTHSLLRWGATSFLLFFPSQPCFSEWKAELNEAPAAAAAATAAVYRWSHEWMSGNKHRVTQVPHTGNGIEQSA